jgi:hypothetical protein
MHRVIQVLELLREVLEHLHDDTRFLRAAMLVNRVWANEAGAVLWRSPPPNALAVVPACRRQHYATLTLRLVFYERPISAAAAALNSVRFPRLVELAPFCDTGLRVTFAGRCTRLHTLSFAFTLNS